MIDRDSPAGSYALALRFPPWLEDGDGTLFNHAFQLAQDSRGHSGEGFGLNQHDGENSDA